ncbi:MAG: [FeFe] hydrogenase H-cluster radical SAM maturase HydE [Peptoniphilaceae bacterium]|nr:[FeFe] hydrogenase H-cluster radical SAM maturase HydE [Peptoniphilaceae bacterium]MDY6019756.1 [FeFe] hydrogenase H-cluster radical SAM maturase HydE [Anaerococcus sp.]
MLQNNNFSDKELYELLTTNDKSMIENLHKKARDIAQKVYSNEVYIRGLIEISNFCRQGCFYCGINRANTRIKRYRLDKKEIIECAHRGYEFGFRTFVLQGGEDPIQDDDFFVEIIEEIKKLYPDTRITLSLGHRSKESYYRLKKAGADRYLLRHESANRSVFNKLHPADQSLDQRVDDLVYMKSLGFHIGTGFMVQAPFSSIESHIEDIKLIRKLKPQMIGIGPFISHKDTIFKDQNNGTSDLTTRLLSILRIENPYALIPSTTALNTIDENGRIKGILSGANVIMPNLSPSYAKENYTLYDKKKNKGLESAFGLKELDDLLRRYGYKIVVDKGDYKGE